MINDHNDHTMITLIYWWWMIKAGLNPGAPAGKVFTSDKSGWALHPLWGNEVDLLYGGDCSVKTSLESGWWVDNMFSGRTEHSLVPFQRGISPHLIWGWKTCKVKKNLVLGGKITIFDYACQVPTLWTIQFARWRQDRGSRNWPCYTWCLIISPL